MKNSVQWHVLAFLPALLLTAGAMTAVTVGHGIRREFRKPRR